MKIAGWIALVAGVALIACLTPFTSWYATSRVEDLAWILAFVLTVAGAFLVAPPSAPRTWLQRAQGLVTRVAVAVALNLLYWVVVIEPHVFYDETPSFAWMRLTGLVDLPIAILGLGDKILRSHAVDVYMQSFGYGYTRFCFGIPRGCLWPHLAIGIPTWIALLYVPAVGAYLRRSSQSANS